MEKENHATLNIYQKLAAVQKAVDVVKKDKKGYGYSYTSDVELLPKINSAVAEYGLTLVPGIVHGTADVRHFSYEKTKGGKTETVNEFLVSADMVYTWVNNDNPEEKIIVPWTMTGNQADSSQAFGSALTYSNRYFLLKYFQCATTTDDPDFIRSKQKEEKSKNELASIIEEIDAIANDIAAKDPSKREKIRELVTKHVDKRDEKGKLVPTGDYKQITKKARATALLRDLNKLHTEE